MANNYSESENDEMEIDGFKALITVNPDTNMFRGGFVDRNGGADFYGTDVSSLQRERKIPLKLFLQVCREDGV